MYSLGYQSLKHTSAFQWGCEADLSISAIDFPVCLLLSKWFLSKPYAFFPWQKFSKLLSPSVCTAVSDDTWHQAEGPPDTDRDGPVSAAEVGNSKNLEIS